MNFKIRKELQIVIGDGVKVDAESLHALKRTISDCYPRCTRDKRKRIPNVEQFFNWGHVLGLRVQQVVDMYAEKLFTNSLATNCDH